MCRLPANQSCSHLKCKFKEVQVSRGTPENSIMGHALSLIRRNVSCPPAVFYLIENEKVKRFITLKSILIESSTARQFQLLYQNLIKSNVYP